MTLKCRKIKERTNIKARIKVCLSIHLLLPKLVISKLERRQNAEPQNPKQTQDPKHNKSKRNLKITDMAKVILFQPYMRDNVSVHIYVTVDLLRIAKVNTKIIYHFYTWHLKHHLQIEVTKCYNSLWEL